MKAIPDRWLEYNACGRVIEGTRLICFKVPLRKEVQVKEPSITQLWDIPSVLAEIPRLSAVIDLTNTARYYNPKEFLAAKVLHKKILMPGRIIPPESKVKEFMDAVDEFLGRDCDSLVGVHCTHGLNRTGYMVCRYMRDRLGIPGPEAIKRFETARGYKIERDVYINGILKEKNASKHGGKEPDHLTDERYQLVNEHNKVLEEVPDVKDQPNVYKHYRGGTRTVNNMPPYNRNFGAIRDRRAHYNDKPYASQSDIANRDQRRSTYNQGPSRSFNNDGYNLRNDFGRPNHLSNERNQFDNANNRVLDEVPDLNEQPNRFNRRGMRRFNNVYPRDRQFDANRDRRGNSYDSSQPPFAIPNVNDQPNRFDRGGMRRFNNMYPRNRQFDANRDRSGNSYNSSQPPFANRGGSSSRYNDRFTPYHKRGSNNFRGNNRINYNDQYDGGTGSNFDRNTNYNWRKRGNSRNNSDPES